MPNAMTDVEFDLDDFRLMLPTPLHQRGKREAHRHRRQASAGTNYSPLANAAKYRHILTPPNGARAVPARSVPPVRNGRFFRKRIAPATRCGGGTVRAPRRRHGRLQKAKDEFSPSLGSLF